jgi:hypothetical protein
MVTGNFICGSQLKLMRNIVVFILAFLGSTAFAQSIQSLSSEEMRMKAQTGFYKTPWANEKESLLSTSCCLQKKNRREQQSC